MIIGYRKLKHCTPGSLIRLRDSEEYILLTEYHSFNGGKTGVFDGYILGTGEAFHPKNENEWVAIIGLEQLEADISEELEYPE